MPGKSQVLVLSKIFTAASQGSHISTAVSITYKEISQPLPGPYISTGSITGSTPTIVYPANYTFAAVSKLTITNSQSAATPSPFQQMVNITSSDNGFQLISPDFGQNVEFFYSNGTVIPSWLESYSSSNAIWWLKLGSIPASSSITVYMGIAPTSTNLFNGVNVGEAPQLPCYEEGITNTSKCSVYGEYDNGANVFNFYDNFAGTSLNTSKWTITTASSFSVNNGLTFTGTSGGGTDNIFATSVPTFSAPLIVDMYGEETGTTSWFGIEMLNYYGSGGVLFYNQNRYTFGQAISIFNGSDEIFNSGGSANNYYFWTATENGGVASYYLYSGSVYGTVVTSVTSGSSYYSATSGHIYLADNGGSAFIQYLRVRAYPPNGVMPSTSFGSVA